MARDFVRTALAARRLYWRLRQRLDVERAREDSRFLELRERYYRGFWLAAAAEVGASVEDLGYGYLRLSRNGRSVLTARDKVAVDDHLRVRAARDKAFVQHWLRQYGFVAPPAVEYGLDSVRPALELSRAVGGPIVVKPADGEGAGRGVTTGLVGAREIVRASIWAATFQPRLLAEKQVEGASYRLLYLDGTLCDAVRRDPPILVGDGRRSIAALIRDENARRLEAGEATALSPIVVDPECRATLARQGLSLGTVPGEGVKVRVKNVVNQNASAENHVVRGSVHPDTVELGARLVRHLGLRMAGVDLLTPDVGAPLEKAGGVVGEINSTPGLHHHDLVSDPARRVGVGRCVLEMALS